LLELYFIFYLIPKMMSAPARERNRSALKWSLPGIAARIGGELFVGLGFGLIYGLGIIFPGWPEEMSTGWTLLLYVAALAAAIGAFTLVRRILRGKSADPCTPQTLCFSRRPHRRNSKRPRASAPPPSSRTAALLDTADGHLLGWVSLRLNKRGIGFCSGASVFEAGVSRD
jgi:hypothetical protein